MDKVCKINSQFHSFKRAQAITYPQPRPQQQLPPPPPPLQQQQQQQPQLPLLLLLQPPPRKLVGSLKSYKSNYTFKAVLIRRLLLLT